MCSLKINLATRPPSSAKDYDSLAQPGFFDRFIPLDLLSAPL